MTFTNTLFETRMRKKGAQILNINVTQDWVQDHLQCTEKLNFLSVSLTSICLKW